MLRNEVLRRVSFIIFLMIVLSAMLSGCALNRWLQLEPGVYTLIQPKGKAEAAVAAEKLEVDRDNQRAMFTMVDGSQNEVSFSFREKEKWPVGCPANIGSTYMEVLDIAEESLTIGGSTYQDPILVRDCPPDPEQVVLREDGLMNVGGSACAGLDKCLTFGRQSQVDIVLTAPIVNAKPLPSSMKGYELYSWYDEQGDGWHYTLVTGTNRLKTVEEITAQENTVAGSEWVKITVRGTEELKDLLERLSPGTEMFWQGGDWLENEQQASVNLMLPESSLVKAIQDHCRELEIQLHLNQ